MDLKANGGGVLLKGSMIIVFLLVSQLSIACFRAAGLEFPKTDSWMLDLYWNPFSNETLSEKAALRSASMEAERRLSFMTFASLRKIEANKNLLLLQRQVNLTPFDRSLWAELLALQLDAGRSNEERLWAMEAALTLFGWSYTYRLRVTAECLRLPTTLLDARSTLCYRLLMNLPFESNVINSGHLGVNYKYLEQRLAELPEFYLVKPKLK